MIKRFAVLAVLALLAAPAFAQKVHIDYDMSAPFGEYETVAWAKTEATSLVDRRGTINTKSTAIFGQLTYRFNDQLGLTVGARYTEDDRDYVSTELALMNPRGEIDVAEVFSEPTWKVGLDYRIDDSRMVYATISTGYKAGTFNRFAPPEPPIPGGPGAIPTSRRATAASRNASARRTAAPTISPPAAPGASGSTGRGVYLPRR